MPLHIESTNPTVTAQAVFGNCECFTYSLNSGYPGTLPTRTHDGIEPLDGSRELDSRARLIDRPPDARAKSLSYWGFRRQ
jgi:hypothetical protein